MIQNRYNQWLLSSMALLMITACNAPGGGPLGGNESHHSDTTQPATPTHDSIIHNGTRYGTVVSHFTGRVWLDRNLGAERVCLTLDDEQCFGDYYQFGRDFDGHQDKYSDTTEEQAENIYDVGHGKFILGRKYRNTWYKQDSNKENEQILEKLLAKWLKSDGSSICPIGFRLPQHIELWNEFRSTLYKDYPPYHFLKLARAGRRDYMHGEIKMYGVDNDIQLWVEDTRGGGNVNYYDEIRNGIYSGARHPSLGVPVRCIKVQ
jgi:hypothetical protein